MSVLSRLIKVLKAYHYANLKRDRWTEAKLEELLKDIEQQYNQAREKAYYTYQSYRRAQEEKNSGNILHTMAMSFIGSISTRMTKGKRAAVKSRHLTTHQG